MKLLYIPPLGGGIRDLFEAGQHRRLFENYCVEWLKAFDEVLILSFFDEKLTDYPDVKIPKGVTLLPNRKRLHRYLYAMLAPFIHRAAACDAPVIRVSQTTGSMPAFFFKHFGGGSPRVAMTYGYDYALFAGSRGRRATWLARLHEFIGRKTADAWITTTPELVRHLEQNHGIHPRAINLIPNGVDLELFKANEPAPIPEGVRSLVFVGRLEAQKNLFFLIDCVGAAAETLGQDLKLVLIGEGSLKQKLENHPRSRRVNLELIGRVEQSRLAETLKRSQAYVIASLHEGHPKAVLEAMACGLPVLGLEAPGVTELLGMSGQKTFTDMESFVGGLSALLSPEARAKAANDARAAVFGSFDLKANITMETGLLQRLGRL